jgi:hypothetical protein
MAAIAAGIGRAHIARIVQGSRRNRRDVRTPYVAPHEYVPRSTADLWKGARPRPVR